MGFPWSTTKRKYLTDLPPIDEYQDPVEFTDEVMERVEERLSSYLRGERTYPIYKASLKDEALPFQKIEAKKTRVFMAAPVDFTLVMRSVLLSFVRISQRHRYIFESAPGLEAQSSEWDELYHYLTKFGDNKMIFGDFSGFDVTMRANFLLSAFKLIEDFHRARGFDEKYCRVIRCIAYDVTFPVVNYNGALIELFGKNPSGQALTVTINGIVNSMYMRYCYKCLNPRLEIRSFRRNVNLITYGDDNGMGASDDCPWFNHTSISKTLEKIGVKYTMADKCSHTVPYIHIDDADFLKRKWRYEKELGKRVCPLDVSSIYKSLMIGIKSKAISPQDHAASIIRSANSEFFWHGKEIFEIWQTRFRDMIANHGLEPFFVQTPLETWDDLIERYKRNSSLELQSGDENIPFESRACFKCGNFKFDHDYSILKCIFCNYHDECMLCGCVTDVTTICDRVVSCSDCRYYYANIYLQSYPNGANYPNAEFLEDYVIMEYSDDNSEFGYLPLAIAPANSHFSIITLSDIYIANIQSVGRTPGPVNQRE
jgi:hypothetical protein